MKACRLALAKGRTVSDLAHGAAGILDAREHLTVRLLKTAGGEYIVQAGSRNGRIVRRLGLDRRLSLMLAPDGAGHVLVRTDAATVRGKLLARRILRRLRSKAPP